MADHDEPTRQLDGTHTGADVGRGGQVRRFGLIRAFFGTILGLAVVAALVAGAGLSGLFPGLPNPFAVQETDRSQPPVLLSIKDLSRFVAAEGNFEVVIDLKKDRRYVPDWLLNERTLFVAAGRVEAYVDFADLTDEAIVVSDDRTAVEVTLPSPQLDEPELDLERSYVFAEERGLINRIGDFFDGDPNRQQDTLQVAEDRLAEAAADSNLVERAEQNTRKTLEGILHSLGYTSVTVTFAAP